MRVDAERGDRTAVHMSVILLTELLSLNCAVTDHLSSHLFCFFFFLLFSSLSLICLFDFLRLHLILSNVSKRMVNSLLYLTSFLFPPSVLSLLFFFFFLILSTNLLLALFSPFYRPLPQGLRLFARLGGGGRQQADGEEGGRRRQHHFHLRGQEQARGQQAPDHHHRHR